ncbi:hypothetical protein BH11ACT6_BH11ACT6_34710 [soil metagenome]
MTELDTLAKQLTAAKADTLRTDEAHRQALTHERRTEAEYKALHAQVHPPATIEVVVPEGMKHVGWLCKHELINAKGWTYTPHRRPDVSKKRGWSESTNVSSGFDHTIGPLNEDAAEKNCQYRQPVFVRIEAL